jgi:hypothetical protein
MQSGSYECVNRSTSTEAGLEARRRGSDSQGVPAAVVARSVRASSSTARCSNPTWLICWHRLREERGGRPPLRPRRHRLRDPTANAPAATSPTNHQHCCAGRGSRPRSAPPAASYPTTPTTCRSPSESTTTAPASLSRANSAAARTTSCASSAITHSPVGAQTRCPCSSRGTRRVVAVRHACRNRTRNRDWEPGQRDLRSASQFFGVIRPARRGDVTD